MKTIDRQPCRSTAAIFADEGHGSAFFVALSHGLRWLYEPAS